MNRRYRQQLFPLILRPFDRLRAQDERKQLLGNGMFYICSSPDKKKGNSKPPLEVKRGLKGVTTARSKTSWAPMERRTYSECSYAHIGAR